MKRVVISLINNSGSVSNKHTYGLAVLVYASSHGTDVACETIVHFSFQLRMFVICKLKYVFNSTH